MTAQRALVYLWAGPTTLLGLAFLPFARCLGGQYDIVDGVLEIHGGLAAGFLRYGTGLHGGASAMTLGHVILGTDAFALEIARAHEHIHVHQAERWGPLFVAAYLLASLWALLRGRSAYRGNVFEREAYGEL